MVTRLPTGDIDALRIADTIAVFEITRNRHDSLSGGENCTKSCLDIDALRITYNSLHDAVALDLHFHRELRTQAHIHGY